MSNHNAAERLLRPNLVGDRAERVAFIDRDGAHTYTDVASDAARFANRLRESGLRPGERILLAMTDTAAFPVCFLGAMQAGVVPVPLNTLLTANDYSFIVNDSEARAIVASPHLTSLMPQTTTLLRICTEGGIDGWRNLAAELERLADDIIAEQNSAADVAFWLYTSGTTGQPKGVMHTHASPLATAEHYGRGVLGLTGDDVVYSAAKLFFAYGLGNSLTIPMSVGATVVLVDTPPTPEGVRAVFEQHRPTMFFGVPTLYSMLLNTGNLPPADHRIRTCVSAGEALPEAIFDRWHDATGLDILDGIGSTEMLHIYMSNRTGNVQPGTSGTPVSGYEVALVDDAGTRIEATGEIGDLYVSGPSLTAGYWNRTQLNEQTFDGEWMHTGDKYLRTAAGAYEYCGRSDDLLKVGGIYVSPMEVENALLAHDGVAQAAVVGHPDDDQLIKPRAFVVAAEGWKAGPEMESALIEHVTAELAPYKRPRWVTFVDDLPKTATGKIQRFKLRT